MTPTRERPHGFAIVSAIFILVVLAALGAFIINISSSQQIGSALDVQGARAYQAARAGIEWGLFQAQATPAYNFSYGTPAVAVGNAPSNLRACPPSPSSFQPVGASFVGMTVTVVCTATVDASGGPTVYAMTSTACSPASSGSCPNTTAPGALYVERRLAVTF